VPILKASASFKALPIEGKSNRASQMINAYGTNIGPVGSNRGLNMKAGAKRTASPSCFSAEKTPSKKSGIS
jgi:hypothetical protein